MPVTIDGLVTGIDTQTIISGLLKIQKQQVDRFTLRKDEVQKKQAAFKSVETRLLSLQLDASELARSQNNPFTKPKVTVSDESAISGSATESAAPGVYRFTVDSRAAAHQVGSQGFADPDSQITTGTFDLRLGNGDVTTITVDDKNNSLKGLADAINAARGSVTANVIKDSSNSSTPYKLLLTSSKTGAENSISLTNNLASDSGTAIRPEIDFGTPVQVATNAEITFGSGAGAISTTSSTNRFSEVVRGVTFDLLNPTIGKEVAITVDRNSAAAVDDVQTFFNSFNDVIQYIDDQSRYVSESGQSGPLLGNRNVQTIKQKLLTTVLDVVPGVSPSANRMSAIGVTINNLGRLQLDSAKLQSILDGQVEGVSAVDVKRLFALGGSSDNPKLTFVAGSLKTKSSVTPIQVNITQAAEQAALTAEAALVGSTLKISSVSYGTTSKIEIVSGTALANLGLVAGQLATGKDVQGSFLVNGLNEVATGKGQILSGDKLNENTAGLQLRVALSASNVSNQTTALFTVTRGIGANFAKVTEGILSATNGLAAITNTVYDKQLSDLQASLERQQAVFDRQQVQLKKQFSALESAISSLQSTSSYVSSQLASLSGMSR